MPPIVECFEIEEDQQTKDFLCGVGRSDILYEEMIIGNITSNPVI